MKKRLFIAIDIPEELSCGIRRLELNAKGFKSSKAEQLHITLRFIGDFPENDIPELIKKLEKIKIPEFELSSTSPGFFPNKKRPSIFYLGFSDSPDLIQLKSDIDDVLEGFGLEKETLNFIPHLTLGKFKRRIEKDLPNLLIEKSAKLASTFNVKEFILFSSELTNEGAIHSVEARF